MNRFELRRLAVALAGVLAAALGLGGTAQASTPTLVWRDAARLGVQCVVKGGPGVDRAAVERAVCGRLQALAADGAPMPVTSLAIGDPALFAPDTVVLLVHAAVQPAASTARGGQGQVVVFAARPFRSSAEPTEVLYGAAPRAAPLANSARPDPELDAALRATLDEVLPWRASRGAGQAGRL